MISAVTESLGGRQLPSLTSILYRGAPMQQELITRTTPALPGAQLWQAYGQTEASPILTLLAPEHHGPGDSKARSAGSPVPGCEVTIRHPDTGDEMPQGVVGEICGTGANVMSGYWHRPDLTESALRDGWLHTGDAGYLDEDGFPFVACRFDEMIITGGEHVYRTEVESVLCRHPAVAEAAVTGLFDDHPGQWVHVVLVFRYTREHLAGFMCPRTFEVCGSLPRTGAGKVDKKALASMAVGNG